MLRTRPDRDSKECGCWCEVRRSSLVRMAEPTIISCIVLCLLLYEQTFWSRVYAFTTTAREPEPSWPVCKPMISNLSSITPYLQPVVPAIPFHRGREIFAVHINAVMSSETLVVAGKHNLIFSGRIDAYSVVRERLSWVHCLSTCRSCKTSDNLRLKMNNRPARSKTITLSPSCLRETYAYI